MAELENKASFDRSITGVESRDAELENGLARTTYVLDDGMIYLFLQYDGTNLDGNEKHALKSVTMYAKNAGSDKDILKHGNSNKKFSFEKVWN